jgi:hypothetical protein
VSFTLWATPFVGFITVIPAAFLNRMRVDVSRSLDTVNGGDYTNATLIKFDAGSAGWQFDSLVTIGGTGAIDILNSGTLTLESGGSAHVKAGGVLYFESTGAAYGEAIWQGVSKATFQSGSELRIIGATALLTVSGGADINVTGAVTTFTGGTQSFGGTTTIPVGATLAVGGTLTSTGNSSFSAITAATHPALSTDTYANNSQLTHSSGSTETWLANAIVNQGGTTTRTGPERVLGTEAWSIGRPAALGPNASGTIDCTAADIMRCPALTAGRSWTLGDPGGLAFSGLPFTVERSAAGSTIHTLTILDADGVTTIGSIAAATDANFSITFCWSGTVWFPLRWSSHVGAGGISLP